MLELNFESVLTLDEIENNFKDIDFFSGIMESLQESLAIQRGERKGYANACRIPQKTAVS